MSREVFVGLDWACQDHELCVIEAAGKLVERRKFAHNRDGLGELMRWLGQFGSRLRIAIERPSGLIVDALVHAGHQVFPIHPNAVKASRPRYRRHGKSDRGDAYVLADLLRTDGHRWSALSPQSDAIRALRALVRSRDDLVRTRVALGNELQSTLDAYWPGAAGVFADITSCISLAFLADYPSPAAAAGLDETQPQQNAAARGLAGPLASDAMAQVVASLVAILQQVIEQLGILTRRIERLVESLPDGQIIMSFPRAGRLCAAQILAELGDVRERFPGADRLFAEAGVVPVTYQSGKTKSVVFRWACNHRLRRAITCLADNSRRASTWANTIYSAARARGCDHPHAIRILARAWLRVIWRAWFDHTPYSPELHLGAVKAFSPGG
jgi:transposase